MRRWIPLVLAVWRFELKLKKTKPVAFLSQALLVACLSICFAIGMPLIEWSWASVRGKGLD
jgi:hypothetical protein